jgi:transcriptional regulator with XRE-family HTH domain
MTEEAVAIIPTIGEVVRAWREFRGLRPTELAQRAGVRKSYLSELEHNKTANPKQEHLAKIAEALAIPVLDILARRMPGNADEETVTPHDQVPAPPEPKRSVASRRRGDFSFGSPVRSSRSKPQREQLQAILTQIDALRGMVEHLLADEDRLNG